MKRKKEEEEREEEIREKMVPPWLRGTSPPNEWKQQRVTEADHP